MFTGYTFRVLILSMPHVAAIPGADEMNKHTFQDFCFGAALAIVCVGVFVLAMFGPMALYVAGKI